MTDQQELKQVPIQKIVAKASKVLIHLSYELGILGLFGIWELQFCILNLRVGVELQKGCESRFN